MYVHGAQSSAGFGKESGLSTMLLVHTNADLSGCFKLLQMKEQSVFTIIFVLLLSVCFKVCNKNTDFIFCFSLQRVLKARMQQK